MLNKYFFIVILCLSVTNLYASIANGGACNPNGLTSTSNAVDIAIQDTSCISGFCSLSEKKCIAKYGLEKTCNRNAQCAEGTCFNLKCLLSAGSYCTVASNCSSGVCTNNKCAIANGGACNPNGLTSTSNPADITIQDASCSSGLCSLSEKKCIDSKVALGLTCDRNTQCQTGTTCFNSKCLLPDGSACNPTGLTSTSNAADIVTQDTSCTSGFCSLSEKKCIAKYGLEKTCNRNAQCQTGTTCFNSKCLLPAGSSCTVATNCSSGVCTNNKCAIETGGACNPNGLSSTSNAVDIAIQDASCTSGLCSLSEKKCIDSKVALGLACDRNAQCQTGATCFNSKCLIPDGGACNPNGLTSTSNAVDIAIQDTSCISGFCSLSEKKCIAKYGLEKTCNRNAQCAEGTCSNSKCLLIQGSNCSVATNCSSGICNWNTGQTNVLGKCA